MTDLTAITTPFGLLDRETQEALKAHGGPWEFYANCGDWLEVVNPPAWFLRDVYRVKPAPPKPREWWAVQCGKCHVGMFNSEKDANTFLDGYGRSEYEIIHVHEVLE